MPGRLIYLIGPSGSGKDTVLQGVSRLLGPRAIIASRCITRPVSDTERGAISLSEAEFVQIEREGGFAMSWRANGLSYGVPSHIEGSLAIGFDVLINGSREFLPEARRRYPQLMPVLLRVDDAALRQRLLARGRESLDDIRRRLDRNTDYDALARSAQAEGILVLDNSGPVENAIQGLYHHLLTSDTSLEYNHAADTTGYGQRSAASRL